MNETRVLQLKDLGAVQNFERSRSAAGELSEMDQEMQSWNSSWRSESLEHYLPLGWSFGIWQKQNLAAYFIAQPLLFMCTLTQTLWVERIQAGTPDLAAEILDVAYKICREKHFQRAIIYLPQENELKNFKQTKIQLNKIEDNIFELKTAKY